MDHTDLSLLSRALVFAAHKHRDQRRKGVDASPYINHPIAVLDLLISEGGVTEPRVLAAAVLHDTLEDTETSPQELAEHFGGAIRDLVQEVTDDKRLPKAERKRLQIEHAPHLSPAAKLIKLADKTVNLRDILERPPGDWSEARKREYFDWAATVVAGLRGVSPPLEAVFDRTRARAPRGS